MDIAMIILRLVHVLSGVTWAGTLFTTVLFVAPATRAAGQAGAEFNQALGRHTKIGLVMPLATLLTLLSGFAMYMRDSGHLSPVWLATRAGITLTIGALSAIIAFFGPGLSIAVTQRRLAAQGGTPAAQADAQVRLRRLNHQMAVLVAIAVICMAIFRYV